MAERKIPWVPIVGVAAVAIGGTLVYIFRDQIADWMCKTFGIFCIPVPCSPIGSEQITEYCPDGTTWKSKKVCTSVGLITNTQICPVAPCVEGTQQTKYCPEAEVSIITAKCINGVWQPTGNTCPVVPSKSTVTGTITEHSESWSPMSPVQGAKVTLSGETTYTAYTGADGTFSITDVEFGVYDVVVEKENFFMYTGIYDVNINKETFSLDIWTKGILVMRVPTSIELRYDTSASFWGAACCWTILAKHKELPIRAIAKDQKGIVMGDVNILITPSPECYGGFEAPDGKVYRNILGSTDSAGELCTRFWAWSQAGEARGFEVAIYAWSASGNSYTLPYDKWIRVYGSISISGGAGSGAYTCYGKCEKSWAALYETGDLVKGGVC